MNREEQKDLKQRIIWSDEHGTFEKSEVDWIFDQAARVGELEKALWEAQLKAAAICLEPTMQPKDQMIKLADEIIKICQKALKD